MSITDELREWAEGDTLRAGMSLRMARDQVLAIADRIDAKYQKADDEWKAKGGQSWLHGYDECRAELMEGNEAIAACLEEAGWVQLPKDADGKVIRIGDVMTHDFGDGKTVTVLGFGVPNCHDTGQGVFAYHGEEYGWYSTSFLHHDERTTVESTLRELCAAYMDTPLDDSCDSEFFAKYAERIREAVEHE